MSGRRGSLLACCAALLALGGVLGAESVVNSKHNLSVTGPGTVKAVTETQVCLFCHAPHDSSPAAPLWNRYDGGMPYTPYSSSTAFSSPGQPTGASKLCLSCHDGTIALGMVRSRASEILFPGTGKLDSGASFLGTDLSDDHPVSFAFDQTLATQQGQLADPALLTGPVRLDAAGQLQCTSCHDPHDDQYGKFLVMDNRWAALCTDLPFSPFSDPRPEWWGFSTHRFSAASWNGLPPNPWPHTDRLTVADNACENCHRPHAAALPQRLGDLRPLRAGLPGLPQRERGRKEPRRGVRQAQRAPGGRFRSPRAAGGPAEPARPARGVRGLPQPPRRGGLFPTVAGALFGVRGQSAAGTALAQHRLRVRAVLPLSRRQPGRSACRG